MSDREYWDLYNEDKRKRKEERRTKNEVALRASPWPWEQSNRGASWLLRVDGMPKVDFFPGTGRWRIAGRSRTESGDAEKLLRWLDKVGQKI